MRDTDRPSTSAKVHTPTIQAYMLLHAALNQWAKALKNVLVYEICIIIIMLLHIIESLLFAKASLFYEFLEQTPVHNFVFRQSPLLQAFNNDFKSRSSTFCHNQHLL